ncbi:hypothetical protein GCM10023214_58960 [Amycolatopsis dongchuanensis]|uniref:Uncharacterized protein n=1 Tax=Amycolatopsis dongchuanensis TaxID=1070866 RepID=A0ABP8VE87_9PSEU
MSRHEGLKDSAEGHVRPGTREQRAKVVPGGDVLLSRGGSGAVTLELSLMTRLEERL